MSAASEFERQVGLEHISDLRSKTRSKAAVERLAAPPEPQPEPVAHEVGCPFCRRERCWACEEQKRSLADCRHDVAARHGGGDLTNPPAPEPEPDVEPAPPDEEPRGEQ